MGARAAAAAGEVVREVLSSPERAKLDPGPDREFYAFPRLVKHVDEGFTSQVTELYRQYIPPDAVVLDLCSSWVSHLPPEKQYKEVRGRPLLNKYTRTLRARTRARRHAASAGGRASWVAPKLRKQASPRHPPQHRRAPGHRPRNECAGAGQEPPARPLLCQVRSRRQEGGAEGGASAHALGLPIQPRAMHAGVRRDLNREPHDWALGDASVDAVVCCVRCARCVGGMRRQKSSSLGLTRLTRLIPPA